VQRACRSTLILFLGGAALFVDMFLRGAWIGLALAVGFLYGAWLRPEERLVASAA
jgi:hypothetical protein